MQNLGGQTKSIMVFSELAYLHQFCCKLGLPCDTINPDDMNKMNTTVQGMRKMVTAFCLVCFNSRPLK